MSQNKIEPKAEPSNNVPVVKTENQNNATPNKIQQGPSKFNNNFNSNQGPGNPNMKKNNNNKFQMMKGNRNMQGMGGGNRGGPPKGEVIIFERVFRPFLKKKFSFSLIDIRKMMSFE